MPNRSSLWLTLGALTLGGVALGAGLWLGGLRSGSDAGDPTRLGLQRQVASLQLQLDQGTASEADQQRLLELLVALGRQAEATTLLERLADQQPQRWPLRLLLAELRRQQNDRSGASREVRQVLNGRPDQIEALQLLALLLLEEGQGQAALQRVQASFERQSKPRPRPEALATGLLLAELQQQLGQPGQAEALLVKLAASFRSDPRPLLARALLLQQRGRIKEAQALLAQARALRPGQEDQRLDQVAAAWGLESLRGPSPSPLPKPPQAPSALRNP
jgi:tetratricopeptide (TPR) repeat protein